MSRLRLSEMITLYTKIYLGFNFYTRLFPPRPRGEDDVHVRLSDGRPGVQQGVVGPGDDGHDGLQELPDWGHSQLGIRDLEPHHSVELLRNGNTGF